MKLKPLSSRVYVPTKTKIKRSRRDLDLEMIRLKLLEEENAKRRKGGRIRIYPVLD